MASTKNSERKKRKYNDRRKSVTSVNKAKRPAQHDKRNAYFTNRTEELVGKKVKIRTKDGPELGTVQAIITRPPGAVRQGRYLRVVTATDSFDRPRSRVKVLSHE